MVRGVNEATEFYQRAMGAELLYRGTMPNGMTLYAQLRVGTSFILLSDEIMSHGGMPTGSPLKLGGTSAILEINVDDVDRAFDRAIRAGGRPWAKWRMCSTAIASACSPIPSATSGHWRRPRK
jgi:PhnB protein